MNLVEPIKTKRLNRTQWHNPLVSIVVTHHNYSDHIEDALLSIVDQTYEQWECVIVDDCSDKEHYDRLIEIVRSIGCQYIRIRRLEESVGQIGAFFTGLNLTEGHFVCPLDPDDRYTEEFLEQSVVAHLNERVFCPLVCCDQYTLVDNEVVASVMMRHNLHGKGSHQKYIPAHCPGWHWSSTSSMMFRRSALEYLRPYKPIIINGYVEKRGLDSYLAPAAHKLGGSIIICEPLVYRSAHHDNAWLRRDRCSLFHSVQRDDAVPRGYQLRLAADDVMKVNGAPICVGKPKRLRILRKWKKSILKRLPKIF